MRTFYIALISLSGGYLLVQLVCYLFKGKIFFPDAGELFTNRKERTLWQTVFPKDMLRLIIFVFTGSISGLLIYTAGMVGWISLLLAAVAGVFINFLISVSLEPLILKFSKSAEPSDAELEGLSGKVVEAVTPELFGVISVTHGKRSYLFRAVCANGRPVEKGKTVTVIYAQDGCCFVESDEHFCDVLFPLDSYPEEYFKK